MDLTQNIPQNKNKTKTANTNRCIRTDLVVMLPATTCHKVCDTDLSQTINLLAYCRSNKVKLLFV